MSANDIVTLLLQDHEAVRLLLEGFADSNRTDGMERFKMLAKVLVPHEVGEEVVLYPVLRMAPGGAAIADARLVEQSEATDLLSQMERADPSSAEFAVALKLLRSVILDHDESEEEFVFPMLRQQQEHRLLIEMGRRYLEIKNSASVSAMVSVKETAASIRQSAPEVVRAKVTQIRAPAIDEHETDEALGLLRMSRPARL